MTENQKPKRRARYKGTHPKTFKEKYKEHNPEKYSDEIEKAIQRGNTPAGMHISIAVNEILEFFQIKPGQIGFDATLGYGGHTLEMLKCLEHQGCIFATDVDPIESQKTKARLESLGYGEDMLKIRNMNFSEIDKISKEAGKFDFILADLGVSSMQIDNPDRGFTYKREGPLDLRLNPEKGVSAAERLKEMNQYEIEGMLLENSDEPHAEIISKAIIKRFEEGEKIETTSQLRDLIEDTLSFIPSKDREQEIKKTCQRVFQALRIDVNQEFEVLYDFLEKLPDVLAPNGKVLIMSFHSGEDRLVKKSFKNYYREGIYSEISTEVIRPSAEECNRNPRARSAKIRFAIRA